MLFNQVKSVVNVVRQIIMHRSLLVTNLKIREKVLIISNTYNNIVKNFIIIKISILLYLKK